MRTIDQSRYDKKFWREFEAREELDRRINKAAVLVVKRLINYPWWYIEEHLEGVFWYSEGFVKIIKQPRPIIHTITLHNRDLYKIIRNGVVKLEYFNKYAHPNGVEWLSHYLVHQFQTGEDSYCGTVLFPLRDGRYWRVSFTS